MSGVSKPSGCTVTFDVPTSWRSTCVSLVRYAERPCRSPASSQRRTCSLGLFHNVRGATPSAGDHCIRVNG
ncbi:hypothetical protein D3C72_2424990 [compost metagenome]